MTRETKIGLLVGLAFIIVIGILLSDHLTTRGELPQAQLTQVGGNVRMAVNGPAGANAPLSPVVIPTGVTPNNTVPTSGEINSQPASAIVQVSPPRGPVNVPQTAVSVDVSSTGTIASSSEGPSVTHTPVKGDHFGTPLMVTDTVAVNNSPLSNDPLMQQVTQGQTPQTAIQIANNYKPHKAEKGDTVSHLAAKFLGANTTANRQAIIDANPSLKADPAKIVIGRTYNIPAAKGTETVASTEPATTTTTELVVKPEVKAVVAKATTSYKVKDKETIWAIAKGDTVLMKEIQDLNKDVLKGTSNVRAGMTLKIPAKTTVASR